MVKNRTKRSDQAIALRRRSARMARMCRIDGLRSMAEMFKNPLDDCGLLNAGDHPQLPAALSAGLDINGEHPLEALCPRHRPLAASDRCLTALGGSDGVCPGHNLCPVRARRCEHAMVPGQVRAGFWHQRGEAGNKVFGLKDHVRGAVAIRCLQRIAYVPAPATPTVIGTRTVRTASLSGTVDHPVPREVQRGAKLAINALCWPLILYQPVPKKDAYAQCTAGSGVSCENATLACDTTMLRIMLVSHCRNRIRFVMLPGNAMRGQPR